MNSTMTHLDEDERTLLIDSLRQLLQRNADGEPKDTWRQLTELGLTQLARPSGAGGLREATLALQELGRVSSTAPLIGAVLANLVAEEGGALAPLLERLDAGDAGVAFAFAEFDGEANAGKVTLDGNKLSGCLRFVEGLPAVTDLLVPLAGALAWVNIEAVGAQVTATPILATEPLHELVFDGAEVVTVALAPDTLDDLLTLAQFCATARALGAARCALEEVIEYAKTRTQFGQPIGRFQAIQHKLVNCFTSLEAIRLSSFHAAEQFDLGNPQWRFFATATSAFASQALRQVALEAHHTFGAIGYSEEHGMPSHFRRIHSDALKHGGVRHAREALATRLLGARL